MFQRWKENCISLSKDGTTNLGLIDLDPENETSGTNFKSLTSFTNGEQVYNPKFSTMTHI